MKSLPAVTVHPTEPGDSRAGWRNVSYVCYEGPGFHGVFEVDTPAGKRKRTKPSIINDEAVKYGTGMALVAWRSLVTMPLQAT